ncbi:MAG TPA: helix-turn-helix transcriptional regulator [Thermoanaerobaculia bacterium]|nr:helix-turn-helix transcriptional regulator [Thermoanaerobaculia bacterium]
MDPDRKSRLEAAGFKFGTVGELFGLTQAEEELVEMKVAISEAIRELREVHSLSQADLARLIGTGQARVSKLERSSESTSLDTLFRCMLVLGATRQDLAKAIAHSTRPKRATGKSQTAAKGSKSAGRRSHAA